MLKVVVLAGGNSAEQIVSTRSGQAVAEALQQAGYPTELLDPAAQSFKMADLANYDVVFIALHGAGGEDGTIQKQLEDLNIAFVGSDSQSSALCFDKYEFYHLLRDNHIQQPSTELVDFNDFKQSPLAQQGFVLKPVSGGSSIDTLIIKQPAEVTEQQIDQLFQKHQKLLLQPLIRGLEITVAILGEQSLPVIEIIPPDNGLFDYENKYNGATAEVCPPQQLSPELQDSAQRLALHIHQLAGCSDLSRTDMIVTEQSELYVLETNTIPGLTGQSLLPKAASAAGYDMPKLCRELVERAHGRQFTAAETAIF